MAVFGNQLTGRQPAHPVTLMRHRYAFEGDLKRRCGICAGPLGVLTALQSSVRES